MIKIENVDVVGWEHAIRGMRNAKNSWDRIDTNMYGAGYVNYDETNERWESNGYMFEVGPNDHKLMTNLATGGPVHAKYRRMIVVYLDITAPLYFWKEFDTYKVGTVANSCSTMHKIHAKEFTLDDFSHEHLIDGTVNDVRVRELEESVREMDDFIDECQQQNGYLGFDDETGFMAFAVPFSESRIDTYYYSPKTFLETFIIPVLNANREAFLKTNDKKYWWQMIQLLPSSYNQKRTVMLNYEVLVGIYKWRKNHKLDEWREFCKFIESLPYSELITGGNTNEAEI